MTFEHYLKHLMAFRNVRTLGWLTLFVMWTAVIVGSYIFVGKPPACFTITRLPFTIESAGCYQLTGDLVMHDPAGTGVLIRSNNVRLDLGGHRIKGPSISHGSGVGVAAQGVRDVVVENGTIGGFLYGLRVEGRKGRVTERFTVRKIVLTNNTFRGAAIAGTETLVENVVAEGTGGTLFFPDSFAVGLELAGRDCRVFRTAVRETYPVGKGEGAGILLVGGVEGCTLEHNEVSNSLRRTDTKIVGILLRGSTSNPEILKNRISGFAQASLSACFSIGALPYVIEHSGCYIVRNDLRYDGLSGVGIWLRTGDVHLDLGGYRVNGSSGPTTSAVGIHSEQSGKNIVIENGTVSGFLYGVRVSAGPNKQLTDRFVLRNVALLKNGFRGAMIEGTNTLIENVKVESTGGTLFFPDAFAIGIDLSGFGCIVRNNKIAETHAVGRGEAVAIALRGDTNSCLVEQNELKNTPGSNESVTYGIWLAEGAKGVQMADNDISGFQRTTNRIFSTP